MFTIDQREKGSERVLLTIYGFPTEESAKAVAAEMTRRADFGIYWTAGSADGETKV